MVFWEGGESKKLTFPYKCAYLRLRLCIRKRTLEKGPKICYFHKWQGRKRENLTERKIGEGNLYLEGAVLASILIFRGKPW